jgi:hypothetical protein
MPADFDRHAAKELEPLAIIYRQSPAAVALDVPFRAFTGVSSHIFKSRRMWPSLIRRESYFVESTCAII